MEMLQDGHERLTDGQTDRVNPIYPPDFVAVGINMQGFFAGYHYKFNLSRSVYKTTQIIHEGTGKYSVTSYSMQYI